MKIKFLSIIALFGLLTACESEDVVKEPNKDGSVETVLSIEHQSQYDILHVSHNIWVKGRVDRVITTSDTLVSLGTSKQEGEDAEGNVQTLDVPKDYEMYITVK